jgi:hypothetical protein
MPSWTKVAQTMSLSSLSILCVGLVSSCSDYAYILKEGGDVFYQLEAGEVDVLLIVDDSRSMQPHQEKLSTNFEAFLTYFIEGNVDYHIGVVTTSAVESFDAPHYCSEEDTDETPPPGYLVGAGSANKAFITPETPNGATIFSEWVNVGVCGNGLEMGLEAARLALTEPVVNGPNAGFLREDAYLSLIFVSDEQDSSPLGVNEFINTFRGIKGQRSRDIFNASALVVKDLADCGEEQLGWTSLGTRYLDVAEQTSGVTGNICEEDFEQMVTELSLTSSRLTDTFYLAQMPDPSSIILSVDLEEVPCEGGIFTYVVGVLEGKDTGMIVFDRSNLPPPKSKITVTYDLGNGAVESFCPGIAADTDVTGEEQ